MSPNLAERTLTSVWPHWQNEPQLFQKATNPRLSTPGCHALSDIRTILVDDVAPVAAAFVPELLVATNGVAQFIVHQLESTEQLVSNIIGRGPQLVLLDGALAGSVRGWNLVPHLLKAIPNLVIIGFSAEPTYEVHFSSAGAHGFVHKRTEATLITLQEVSLIAQVFLNKDKQGS